MSSLSPEGFIDAFVRRIQDAGLVDARSLERAGRVAEAERRRIDRVLNQLGLLSDDDFVQSWADVTGLTIAEESDYPDEPVRIDVSPAFFRHAEVVPLGVVADSLDIATLDPIDRFAAAAISRKTGMPVRRKLGRPKDVSAALERFGNLESAQFDHSHREGEIFSGDVERLREGVSDAPVIRLVHDLLVRAVERRASDIHLTISRSGPRVRLRVDGYLFDVPPPSVDLYEAIVSRIKIMSRLDIAERRLPQDGSARAVIGGREIDFRVATMPHMNGEGIVLRILDRSALNWELGDLGVSSSFMAALTSALSEPNGLILMTGPTGSGKTTTLYAALRSIVRPDRNIVTIEDPVEYQLDDRITQIEVNARIGLDFPRALRAVLRQDPDVILVGEIRDSETAAIAARAALTGHLVLASVHTNTALAAIPRLLDMGVEPFILASTIRAAMGQRLVRRTCRSCGTTTNNHERDHNPSPSCQACGGSGFSGRIALTEFFSVHEELRSEITKGGDLVSLETIARQHGMRTLADNAAELVATGLTSQAEVERVLGNVAPP